MAATAPAKDSGGRASERGWPRFLALGDSYTVGESAAAEDRWPMQLVELLRDEGVDVADPHIIARTGWTTDELLIAIEAAAAELRPPYAMVSLLIGVNDQYRGRDLEDFRRQFPQLLVRAIALAAGAGRVIVLSIPDWSVTPFAQKSGRDPGAIAEDIDRFNAVVRAESDRAGARFIDVTPISRLAATEAALLAADGLHPSDAMYGQWAQLALPIAAGILRGASNQ